MNNFKYNKSIILLTFILVLVLVFSHDHSRNHQHTHEHQHDHQHNHQHHDHDHQHDHDHDNKHEHDHSHEHPHQHTHYHPHPKETRQFKMIQNKPHLLQSLKLTPISIFFYGSVSTPQYQEFQSMLPEYNSQFIQKLSQKAQFYYLPAQKFNLTRPNPSLSIYRKINNGEWLMYKGRFQKNQIKNWILKNTADPLIQLNGDQIESFFVQSKKGFILLQFGQFYLLKTKIMIYEFCQKYELFCGKVTHNNKALNMVIQLMRAQKQPGVPKLGYWNPKTQELQIYTKDPSKITELQLMELHSGHEGVIPYEAQLDVAQAIHPETEFIEIQQPQQNLEL